MPISAGKYTKPNAYSGRSSLPQPSSKYEADDITAIGNAHAAPVPTAFFISIPEIFSTGTLNIPPPIPNIDERILATTSGSFALKDQESDGIEIGVIYSNDVANLNINYFDIDTLNEIQFDQSVNTNLDPINREGINLDFEFKPDNKNIIAIFMLLNFLNFAYIDMLKTQSIS